MGQQIGLVTNGRDAADRIRTEGWAGDRRTRAAAKASASMREKSDRLRPVIVPTRRGAEQLMQILETLARVELTDGLTAAATHSGKQPAACRATRPSSPFFPKVTMEIAIALGELRRRGFAVTAIVNVYEETNSPTPPAPSSPTASPSATSRTKPPSSKSAGSTCCGRSPAGVTA